MIAPPVTPELATILASLEIEVVDENERHGPMRTRARSTLEDILKAHGEGHLIYLLRTITESRNNRRALTAPIIWAVHDIMIAHPSWPEDAELWLTSFDRILLEDLEQAAKANRRACGKRKALVTLLFERLWPIFGDEQQQGRLPV